jgi:NAD+ synthase (glutamine-hydrolysing)
MYDGRTDETVFGAPYDFIELYSEYLNKTEDEKKELRSCLTKKEKEQFNFYAKNIENLHKYNLHKYYAKSPAIHLDLWDSSVKGGLDNYYEITKNILSE